jgi:hypothetical protein
MKKIILTGAAFAFLATAMVSCGSSEGTEDVTSATETTGTEEIAPETETTETVAEVPTFSSEEVNQGLVAYKALMDEYLKAAQEKDVAKIQALTTQYAQLSQNVQSWASKLKPEEVQQFTEYTNKLNAEWAAAAQQAVAQ